MMDGIYLRIHLEDSIWDEVYIIKEALSSIGSESRQERNSASHCNITDEHSEGNSVDVIPCTQETNILLPSSTGCETGYVPTKCKTIRSRRKWNLKLRLNGVFLSLFVAELMSSPTYRQCVLNNFMKHADHTDQIESVLHVNIRLICVDKDIIDYAWNRRIERMVIEKRELEHAMSWLSTLGGAFSALGEQFTHCAEMAGTISVKQFKIAMRLGDPLTVSRCKLYLALSFLQTGHLKRAKYMIQQEYRLAKSLAPEICDIRLIRMCHGIWSKLQYLHQLNIVKKQKNVARRDVEP